MMLLEKSRDSIDLRVQEDELLIVQAALNEIAHGIHVREFETRIGAPLSSVKALLSQVNSILDENGRSAAP